MTQSTIISDIHIKNLKFLTQVNWVFYFLNNYKTYFNFKKKKILKLQYSSKLDSNFTKFFKTSVFKNNFFRNSNIDATYLNKNLFNLNFIKKEKIYTKLKYSRVPQYDIVSGGSAALLAGFLGFLIAEKFGFELLDSGDFYFLFMYIVFVSFFLRLILKLFFTKSQHNLNFAFFSLKWLFVFYFNLITLVKNNLFKK